MSKMKNTLKSNIEVNFKNLKDIVVIVEIVVIFVLSFSFGYFLNSKDPLLINSQGFNYFYILILVLTLFYGMGAGILLLALFTFSNFLYLKEFSGIFFLNGLTLSLILGEFHYYWMRKIKAKVSEANYLEQKLREIGIAASAIRISHDILEKSYISKPYTIRFLLSKLIEEKNIEDFLKFISNQFFLESFLFVEYDSDEENMKKIHSYNTNKKNIDLDHPLLKKMFFLKETAYVKDLIDLDGKVDYIATIPVFDTQQKIRAFFLIESMPFIHYNTENLVSIQVISQYFLWNIYKQDNMEMMDKEISIVIPADTKYELFKLYKLNKISNVNSSIVLLKVDKKYFSVIDNFLGQSLKSLDFHIRIENNESDIFIVVLPLVAKEGGLGFVNRMFDEFDFLEEKYRYFIFEIKDINEVNEILKDFSQDAKK